MSCLKSSSACRNDNDQSVNVSSVGPISGAFESGADSAYGASSGGNSRHSSRQYRRDYEELLASVLGPGNKQRNSIIAEGEKHYAGEMFRFYAAILDWERLALQYDQKRGRMQALKIVSMFVESGGLYENGCLSSKAREHLLARDVDFNFFEEAKAEVGRDIMMNPVLSAIISRFAPKSSSSSNHVSQQSTISTSSSSVFGAQSSTTNLTSALTMNNCC